MLSSEEQKKYKILKAKENLNKKEKKLLNKFKIEDIKSKLHSLRRRLEVFQRDLNNSEAYELINLTPQSEIVQNFFSKLSLEEQEICKSYLSSNPKVCLFEAKKEINELKKELFTTQHPILRKVGEILDELNSGELLLTDEDKMDDIDSLNID